MVGQGLTDRGDPHAALDLLRPLIDRARPGSWVATAGPSTLADAELESGEFQSALGNYGRCLRDMHAIGTPLNEAFQIDGCAMALAALGRHEEALMAASLSDLMCSELSFTLGREFTGTRDKTLAEARDALGPAGLQRCVGWARESGLDRGIESIIELAARYQPALAQITRAPPAPSVQTKGITAARPFHDATGLAADVPALGGTRDAAFKLPADRTNFLGREDEIAELDALLRRDDMRLLTLTGPGGSGKTRLAVSTARRLLDAAPDGVVFVDLSTTTVASGVGEAIARTLDLVESVSATPRNSLQSS